ncbi:MAG: parallel beta-helix domain-containing protein [Pseudomonadota bacterium]
MEFALRAFAGSLLLLSGLVSSIPSWSAQAALPASADALRYAFETAQPGTTLVLPPGRIRLRRPLVMYADDVTIRGGGSGHSATDTILAFDRQRIGGEALRLSGSNITVEHLAIENARGDALKIFAARNLIVRDVRTEWTRGPNRRNGAYGIYPVQTEGVLIEDSIARGASDAGIYVGQSRHVVIRDNLVYDNVAGIEAENCEAVDIHDNHAHDNTAGILVFNLPDIPQVGRDARVFNNRIENNNTRNFASRGTPVAAVPAGTGVMILAAKRIELFGNRFGGHDYASIFIKHGAPVLADEPAPDANRAARPARTPRPSAVPYEPQASAIALGDNQFASATPTIIAPPGDVLCAATNALESPALPSCSAPRLPAVVMPR